MPKFLVRQTFYVEANNALEAQASLSVEQIVETSIERLAEEQTNAVPRLQKKESQTVQS